MLTLSSGKGNNLCCIQIWYSDSEEASNGVSEESGERKDGDLDSRPRSSEGAYHLLLKLTRQERPVSFGHVFTKE